MAKEIEKPWWKKHGPIGIDWLFTSSGVKPLLKRRTKAEKLIAKKVKRMRQINSQQRKSQHRCK